MNLGVGGNIDMRKVQANIVLVIGGVITLVFALLLADVVIDTATTALTNASIGSFAGASAIGGLIPFIYLTVVALIGVGMMALGGIGAYRDMNDG
jgi:hypothetical protein